MRGLAEYCRELADEFGRHLIAVALCAPSSLLVLVDDAKRQQRRAFRDDHRYDVHVWPFATAPTDVERGNLPIANDAIAASTPIYDPRSVLPSLREVAHACSIKDSGSA